MAVLDIDDAEVFGRLDTMVRGISGKYVGYSGIEFDDLYSELWLKIIRLVKTIDDPEVLTYNLIATSLFNRAIDLCRAKKRLLDRTLSVDISNGSNPFIDRMHMNYLTSGKYTISGQQIEGLCNCVQVTEYNDKIHLNEILDLFEKGTRERDYVNYVAYYYCDCFLDYSYEQISEIAVYGVRYELAIAKMLNYADDTSTGYRSLKQRVRDTITKKYIRKQSTDLTEVMPTLNFIRGNTQQLKVSFKKNEQNMIPEFINQKDKITISIRDKVSKEEVISKSVEYPRTIVTFDEYETKKLNPGSYEYEVVYVPVNGDIKILMTNDLTVSNE